MQTGLYPETLQEEEIRFDYKQFIRAFETYRNVHPEQSVQQALDTLLDRQEDGSEQAD